MKDNQRNDRQGMDHQSSQNKSQQNQRETTGKNTRNLASNNQNEEETNLGHTKREHQVSADKNTKGNDKQTKTNAPQKGHVPQHPNRGSSAHR